MYGKSRIFLLCLFAIIGVAYGGDSVFVGPKKVTDEIVQSLAKLSSVKEALPVILFDKWDSHELEPVVELKMAEVKDGRLVSGTEFKSILINKQLFFCPKFHEPTGETCLAPKKFEKSQPLQCDEEPIPIVIDLPSIGFCGMNGTGTYLAIVFRICPAEEEYEYKNNSYAIYYMCYDKTLKKMLFANHRLDGTSLLGDKLFTQEREIPLEMNTDTYGHIDADYYNNLVAEIVEKTPDYQLQQLVPTDDMPLAALRKTTKYFANHALQHINIIGVWNKIMKYFREHAIQWDQNRFERYTAVVDIPENEMTISLDKIQKRNIWITIMIDQHGAGFGEKVAVVMNNFIVKDLNKQDKDKEISEKQYIDKLCLDKNHFTEDLKNEFSELGIEARCCKVNLEMMEFFSMTENFKETRLLHIDNLTYYSSVNPRHPSRQSEAESSEAVTIDNQ